MVRAGKKDGANQRQDERSMRDERSSHANTYCWYGEQSIMVKVLDFEAVYGLRY